MTLKYLIGFLIINQMVQAKDMQFERVWSEIKNNSNAINGSRELLEASKEGMKKEEKHWVPNLYLQGQSYVTNDPGANLFGLMSQRKIEQADFAPNRINEPGTQNYSKGSIGINWSLYEGGMKNAIHKASQFQSEAKKHELDKTELEVYSEVSKNYFSLMVLKNQKRELDKISSTIDQVLSRYQIGSKSNPVGYSGLLGLKSLKNRILAISDENKAKFQAYQTGLQELSSINTEFDFNETQNVTELINLYLPVYQETYQESATVKTLLSNASAAGEVVNAEKSRNLPRIGVFAESYAFNGKRDMATGFSTGVYLNWNLFSAGDGNATEQAIHNSKAANFYAKAISQKEKIEFSAFKTMEDTLNKTLETLAESQKLLDEQTNVANNLFKNGMINALQLVEVISRRVDLINSKTEAEVKLIETKATRIKLTNEKPEILK